MSYSNCCFLTWIQISQEAGQVVWYSHLLNFPQFAMIYTIKGFGVISRAKVDVFLELACFFDDPVDVGSLISGFSTFSETSFNIWNFTVSHTVEACLGEFWALLCLHVRWVQLCNSLSILWHCLYLGLEWKLTFSSPVATGCSKSNQIDNKGTHFITVKLKDSLPQSCMDAQKYNENLYSFIVIVV